MWVGDFFESTMVPLDWIYTDNRPDDRGYFENLTGIIFQGGLNWKMIDNIWSNFCEAFNDFSINVIAEFDEADVEQLMHDSGIVRNRAKILATIENAKEFQKIRKKFGSFQKYLDSLKSNNYALVVKELSKRFSRVGPSTAEIFLFSIGENIKH